MERATLNQEELGFLLNKFRHLDKRRGSSSLNFYLTKRCDRECAMCYTDSSPRIRGTDMDFSVVKLLLDYFVGVDNVTLTGGEISILPQIDNLVSYAASRVKKVYVQTNGIGFIRPSSFKEKNSVYRVYTDLKKRFESFPKNVQVVLPATEFHMSSNLGGKANHNIVIQAASRLAHEWDDTEHPQVRFIVKNTPGVEGSGDKIIKIFNLEGLPKDGVDNFPGFITNTGRGITVLGMPKEDIPNSKSVYDGFEGGLSINSGAVFVNETPLVREWLTGKKADEGVVVRLDQGLSFNEVRSKLRDFLTNFPN